MHQTHNHTTSFGEKSYSTNQMIANVLTKLLLQDKHNIDYLVGFGTYSLTMLLIFKIKVV
jgi:hypothetical protein